MLLFWVGSCQFINPDSISTAVISPIELLKITKSFKIISENFELGFHQLVKECEVLKIGDIVQLTFSLICEN